MGKGDDWAYFQWSEGHDLKDLLGIIGPYRGVYLIVFILTKLYHNSVKVEVKIVEHLGTSLVAQ